MIPDVVATGLILAAGALLTQFLARSNGYSATVQQTMVFTVLCFVQLGNALSIRTGSRPIFHRFLGNPSLLGAIALTALLQAALIYLPMLNRIFKISALDGQAVLLVLAVCAGSIGLMELYKTVRKLWHRH
jgi:Ca2+-transporting ATPase